MPASVNVAELLCASTRLISSVLPLNVNEPLPTVTTVFEPLNFAAVIELMSVT